MTALWQKLKSVDVCKTPFRLRQAYAQRLVSEAQFRTGALMLRYGFPIKAVAVTLGLSEFAARSVFGLASNLCAVPHCINHLWTGNRSGVCREHNHAPGYCRCPVCEEERHRHE